MLPPGNLPIQKIGKGGDAKDDQRRDAGSSDSRLGILRFFMDIHPL